MPLPRTRLAVAALGAGLVLPALAALPGAAVIGTASFTLDDCEVTLDPVSTNQVVSRNGTWTTSLSIDHPSPVPVSSGQTVGFDLGQVPAGTIPEALTDTSFVVYLDFEEGTGYDREYVTPRRSVGDFDPQQPLPLGSEEVDDVTYSDSGRYSLGLKKISVNIFGYAADGETFRDYYFECDRPAAPISVVDFGVYDPNADAVITLGEVRARQGESVLLSGRDFSRTPGTVAVSVGGESANGFPVDDIGFIDGQLVVPEFAPPGMQEVRASYAGETATAFLTIVAKPAQLAATKAVKVGKAVTVTGSLFKPGEKVTLKLTKKGPAKKGTKKSFGSSVVAGADGSISKAVKLKKAATGKWKVSAKGASSGRTAAAGFKVS